MASACINRPGMNAGCRWPVEPSRRLDLKREADVRHLRADIEVADELVVRYRDEKGGRRPQSMLGIQVRTGSSGRPRDADAAECRTRLTATITNLHSVRPEQIAVVTSQLTDRGWDPSVTVPVLMFYVLIARAAFRTLQREVQRHWRQSDRDAGSLRRCRGRGGHRGRTLVWRQRNHPAGQRTSVVPCVPDCVASQSTGVVRADDGGVLGAGGASWLELEAVRVRDIAGLRPA